MISARAVSPRRAREWRPSCRQPPFPLLLLLTSSFAHLRHVLFEPRPVRYPAGHRPSFLRRLLLLEPPLRSPILDEPIIPLEGSERRARKRANLVHEVLGVFLREEIRDEPDRGGGTEVELRGDGDEVGGQEGDVDGGKHLELRGEERARGGKECQRVGVSSTRQKEKLLCLPHLAPDKLDHFRLELFIPAERVRTERFEPRIAITRDVFRVEPLAVDVPPPLERALLFPLAPRRFVPLIDPVRGREPTSAALPAVESVARQGRVHRCCAGAGARERAAACCRWGRECGDNL